MTEDQIFATEVSISFNYFIAFVVLPFVDIFKIINF